MRSKPHPLLWSTSFVVIVLSSAVFATTRYVNAVTGSNSNNCLSPTSPCKSIGRAISLSASGDAIVVAAASYTENLSISKNLTLIGAGTAESIVDGGASGSVVTISGTAHVSLSKMTIRNGHAVYGGGIDSNSGTVTLNNDVITQNVASEWGGGIYNKGTLVITNTTIAGNHATFICTAAECYTNGGGIFNDGGTVSLNKSTVSLNGASPSCQSRGFCIGYGGGIFNNNGTLMISMSILRSNSANESGGIDNRGKLTISNSTFTGNSAVFTRGNARGGGISNGGVLTISNSTFSGNSAVGSTGSFGGGISSGTVTVKLQNSIIANSTSGGNCYGTVTSGGYNLSSDNTCKLNGPGDMNDMNPLLGPLTNNGGPTQTMALLEGSPAIDAGDPAGCTDGSGRLLTTDQRGQPRPDKEDSVGCDIGAYEKQSD
jgi:hypothetical protein